MIPGIHGRLSRQRLQLTELYHHFKGVRKTANQIKLHTTDLPTSLDQDFYDDLVENFRLIEQALNNFNSEINSLNGQFNELNKDEIQTELINDAGITVTDNDGETSDIDISDTGLSEIS